MGRRPSVRPSTREMLQGARRLGLRPRGAGGRAAVCSRPFVRVASRRPVSHGPAVRSFRFVPGGSFRRGSVDPVRGRRLGRLPVGSGGGRSIRFGAGALVGCRMVRPGFRSVRFGSVRVPVGVRGSGVRGPSLQGPGAGVLGSEAPGAGSAAAGGLGRGRGGQGVRVVRVRAAAGSGGGAARAYCGREREVRWCGASGAAATSKAPNGWAGVNPSTAPRRRRSHEGKTDNGFCEHGRRQAAS